MWNSKTWELSAFSDGWIGWGRGTGPLGTGDTHWPEQALRGSGIGAQGKPVLSKLGEATWADLLLSLAQSEKERWIWGELSES